MKTEPEQDTVPEVGAHLAGDELTESRSQVNDGIARRLSLRDPLVVVAIVLVVLAGGSAIFFGVRWALAANDENIAYSQTRDDALRAGEQAVKNLNSIDYRDVQRSLELWAQSTTGSLHDQMTGYLKDKNVVSTIQKAKTVTTAKILDAALTELDTHSGTATIIAAVDVTVTPQGQKATDKRTRIMGSLTRTNSGWLLSNVQPVPVQGSGQ